MDYKKEKMLGFSRTNVIKVVSLILVATLIVVFAYSKSVFQTGNNHVNQTNQADYQMDVAVEKMTSEEFDNYVKQSLKTLQNDHAQIMADVQAAQLSADKSQLLGVSSNVNERLEQPITLDLPEQSQARQTTPQKEGNLDAAARQTGLPQQQLKKLLAPPKKEVR